MKFTDILILSFSAIGLAWFAFDRFKYSNANTYRKKLERLNELRKIIAVIKNDNFDTDEIIKSSDVNN